MTSVNKSKLVSVTVRPMVRGDLPEVMILERQLFSDPWPLSVFTDSLTQPDWYMVVAEADRAVVGYACFIIIADEGHLTNIAVARSWQRKSVAKQLLDHILQQMIRQECRYIVLEVRPSNTGAIAFYERHGFVTLYRRPNYYHSPVEDALVLIKYLTE